ncbi:LysR family transcriptional regulator [Chromobacterium amazonense]|uniref:Transcriptional regulator n=1 Tax=Chromobacterium amazonense TaxID=1382803 RepID=A0A1S1X7M5_9NEIS|nr:LysR family transcriptional regulator [Chromobacterium amazonense]KIA78940.1 transcriptional regulator [Chromobacterium piscinae]MDE1713249.1 LysR family transcriptional regulator [Chromobacterium amazonense]MDQ4542285.1 LysR family transcriptional regulator [Chromobacterium amazonense]OHX15516.1 transcriptional regulator [Chromobacterium amazonense]PRP69237.1 transcriptional regulator [Chromobacterium amazonense]
MDTLKALMVFMTTAENGSFSDAARKLGVSPAAISQSIARLEQELEVRLFNRTTRQLTLTEDGRRFYAQCRGPVNNLDSAINQLKASRDEPAGHLRVSMPNSFGRRFILPIMGEFCERYPKVRVFFGLDDHFSDLIEDGYDVGVRTGMMPDSRMVARNLSQMPLYVVASPAYWDRYGRPATPEELGNHDCINFQFPTSGRLFKWEFDRKGERIPVEVNGTYTLNDMEAVAELARLGMGVAQLPGHEVVHMIRSGELEPVLTDMVSLERSIYICFPHRDHIAPRTRVFVDFVVEKLADHPDIMADLPGLDLSAKRSAVQQSIGIV